MQVERKNTASYSKGLTLMELLIVLTIVGVLVTLIAPRITKLPTRTSPQIIQFLENEMQQAIVKQRAISIFYDGKSLTSPTTGARFDLAARDSIEVAYPQSDDYLPLHRLTTFYPDGSMTATKFRYSIANSYYDIAVSPVFRNITYKTKQ